MKKNKKNKQKVDMMKNPERLQRVRSTVYLSGMDKSKSRANRKNEERNAMQNLA